MLRQEENLRRLLALTRNSPSLRLRTRWISCRTCEDTINASLLRRANLEFQMRLIQMCSLQPEKNDTSPSARPHLYMYISDSSSLVKMSSSLIGLGGREPYLDFGAGSSPPHRWHAPFSCCSLPNWNISDWFSKTFNRQARLLDVRGGPIGILVSWIEWK